MEIISDTCWEWCPHCEEEVELQSKFEVQVCPSCGRPILPCNLCVDCAGWNSKDCPLYDKEQEMMKEYERTNN